MEKQVWQKITVQRTAVLEYLQKTKDHPTARKIYLEIRKQLPRVSLSTVYRTLQELKKQNLVREIWVNGQAHYETNFLDHIDFFCERCHRIIDIPLVEIMDIKRRLDQEGFRAREFQFLAKGICKNCQRMS